MTTYVILEPNEWGMRWARPPVAERLLDPEMYIHHQAGNPHHTRDAKGVFYDLNEAAIREGYSATDYDILVHENTATDTVTIGIARGQWMSAATYKRNEQGEAICALGFFHPGHSLSERPSTRMLEGLARACVLSIERGWTAPNAVTLGHRDNPAVPPNSTACPGDYLYAELPTIRNRVAELLAPPEDDMIPLDKPYRSYDSRTDDSWGRKPLLPGQTRTVPVGICTRADIVIGSIGQGADGYLFVNGASDTSAVGFTGGTPIQRTGIPVLTPDGKITVNAAVAAAHFTIDVYATG